jgi:hypothetical protein
VLVTVQTAWLFTRGSESVRIVRAASRAGVMHLLVQGPGETADTHEFSDVLACMNFQADLERRLVSEGYALERFTSDRRASDRTRRHVSRARQRLPQLFL